MWKEFKTFAFKGNVLDLAVAIIIGAAFGKIVSSLVNDVVMPLIGVTFGGLDFSTLAFQFNEASILYGMFIQNVVDFIIIALSVFFFIKLLNRLKRKEEIKEEKKEIPFVPSREEILLTEIRDLLKKGQQ